MPSFTRADPESLGLSRVGLKAVDNALHKLIDDGVLAGAVTMVGRRGKVVHESAMGVKNLTTGEPLAMDTVFRIFSMTKPVTAVAMMILHDEGLWRPEDPIAKHLPEFADVKVFAGLAADGAPILEAPDHAPTLQELMTHTAGFSYGFDPTNPVDALYLGAGVWASENLAEMMGKLAAMPLAYQPGSKWLYSIAMDIQGAIIERLTGMSLPAFMQARIFGPLGMVDTGFSMSPERLPRLAVLYRRSKSRGLSEMERPPLMSDPTRAPTLASGGGGLVSTAEDYARFAQMLLNGGELDGVRIVQASSIALMTRNHLPDALINAEYGVGNQQIRPGFGYGYNGAVFYDPEAAGLPVGQGTYQWDGAAGTWFWIDPVNQLFYVGLIQLMDPNGAPPVQAMTQRLIGEAIVG
jgi:CubicO group peptidase (beta-lactamase class C family)